MHPATFGGLHRKGVLLLSDKPKVADVHNERLNSYGLFGGNGVRSTVTLEDGRTGTGTAYTAERATSSAYYDASSKK